MTSEYAKILESYKYQKSQKAPFTTYVDLACITRKTDG